MEENLDCGLYTKELEDIFEDGLPDYLCIEGEVDEDDEAELRRQDIGLDLYLEVNEEMECE